MIYTSPWAVVPLPECSVYDLVWSNPNGIPDSATAVIDGPTGRIVSRGLLRQQAQELAYGFVHKLRLAPGSVVCILSPNSFYYHLLVVACQCAGLVVSGANAAYTEGELSHQLADSEATTILVHPAILNIALGSTTSLGWSKARQRASVILAVHKDESGPAGQLFTAFDELMVKGKELVPVTIKDPKSTVAYLGYSSGTSGKAKGVRTSHYNMTSVLTMLYPFDVTPKDVQIAVLPLNHIYGLSKLLHWPILSGVPVVVMPAFTLPVFCSLVARFKVSVALLVPPIALLLARDPEVDRHDMSSLRLVVSGAAPLGPDLEKELSARLGCSVAQAYGLTETSPTTHYCPIATPRPGSIGPLLPMMRGRICDPETGKDVPQGQEGELLLQGPNVMLGYLNRPEANAETLIEDQDGVWLKTGDIAYVDSDSFFFITDRLKELIKYSGHQIPPAQLEAELLNCPWVSDVAVVGVYVEDRATEFPRAYVVLTAEGKKLQNPEVEIANWLTPRVANYKKLRGGVVVQAAIPKSPSGKLLRRILRDQAKVEYAAILKAKL